MTTKESIDYFFDKETINCREDDRQEVLAQAENTWDLSYKQVSDRFNNEIALTEVMDRTFIFVSNIEEYLLESPAIALHPEIYEQISLAVTLLHSTYQQLGQRMPIEGKN